MFTYFRKFINKWKFNQGIYIEPTSFDVIIPLNKEDKQMELYHVETQEDYDALMVELEKEGYTWLHNMVPTKFNAWTSFLEDTIIKKTENGKLKYADRNYYLCNEPDTPIEKYKAKKTETTDPVEKFQTAWKGLIKSRLIEFTDTSDNINNPSHYTAGGIETLDYIKAKVSDYPSYAVGNIFKYVSRYEHKNGIEDLKKAQFYLNDLIERMESE
ncbi:TPA: DUF3310 domain-containing protein [Listeria monocytogenes]|uniref:DUF3310 domain-containing protein n=1 Tax=Listeria monocytogenes TaxID=1639 RepID=A0A6W7JA51_LISMN|nr:DUF3310 domain-containing protein [Listeria monocytogenes]EFF97145.1 phage protein [Listeria monocytogenes HPB2262]EAC7505525.1 DUF3310 domain-containing protein [Listeria monocytogenes]EAC8096525.1 DUF3310 domain-containing protein [Listeria monocytogenes]EAC9157110.1 DUF3310 domain-containing protein [Listeria monocytogenes]